MSEPAPLLATKLFVPRPPSQRVKRERLIKRLEVSHPLTLISAPPGFGKTTLVSEWLSAGKLRAAWLSLDEADNDPGRFWTYVIAALQTLNDRVGAGSLPLLQSPQPPAIDAILTLLLNDLATAPDNLALVLDDYHVISAPVIHEALSFLLDHLPPQLRLIIISRVDPLLPLPRLRARGQLNELRADELRFTPAEAAAFLNDVMDLSLAADDIAALEQRTEGWIAGLQLAALSLQDRADPAEFIQSFTGSHRFILDYLIEEVLNRQAPDILNFLLCTSILDRLSAALCEAVIGQSNCQAILEQLDRANLFIVPLDQDRQWFRYHHLFADVLRARLRQTTPETVPDLHRRASQWFEQHASPREAIDHALDSGDLDRAAGLIETATRPLIHRGEMATLSGWLDRLPTDLYQARPGLSLARAWCALALLEFTAIEPQLQAAEEALRDDDPVLRGEIAALRAIIASTSGDLAQTLDSSKQALALLPPDDAFLRGLVAVSLGNLYYTTGDPKEAEHYGAEAIIQFERVGNRSFELVARSIQAVALEEQGQMHQAAELYRLALQRGQHNQRLLPLSGVAVACLGLGGLLHDWYQLDEAAHWFQQGADLCRQLAGLSGVRITLINGLAAVKRSRRDFVGAIELFRNSKDLTRQLPLPEGVEQIETQIALTHLRQGKVADASAWAERQGEKSLPAADPILSFGDEDRLIVLAQVRAGQGRWAQAEDLLERVLRSGVAAHRSAIQIEAHVLRALTRQAQGRTDSALSELEQALTLAEPENYLRPFCDEGEAVRELLTRLRPRLHEARGRAYTDRVLTALAAIDLPVEKPAIDVEPLSEPLNDREQEVLRLIADGLSNREIADRLVVAVGTVKWYINSLYGKLGVTSRTQALARAKDLRLL